MIFPQSKSVGKVELDCPDPLVAGARVTLKVIFTVGYGGLNAGGRLRIGLPNTGWEKPVVPQVRYWDELIQGKHRRYAPFYPVNTSSAVKTAGEATVYLEVMERMLLPDEDPAEAYWRWWITARIEDAPLIAGDQLIVTYGDCRFVGHAARIQTFPENRLTTSVYVDPGDGQWVRPEGAPVEIDVVGGPPDRANVIVPSVTETGPRSIRVALTDRCHCRPNGELPESLVLRDSRRRQVEEVRFSDSPGVTVRLKNTAPVSERMVLTDPKGERVWGIANPCILRDKDGMQLFWGDLHAQSEYHVMHSQKKDARQSGWSKGISCGTPDEVYQYARELSLLDFVAITDQGAITGVGWELLQQKAAEYHRPGEFVTFKAYEAGSPVGHRNVYYRGGNAEPPQDAKSFSYKPDFLYKHYAGRKDVLMIPHHVKTWTDWSFHDPDLEPVMEVYSCWGQSENASMDRWDKGMTPGAGAWEALKRGYRLGMIASSDNHVGMPGRSYPHDRQVHTPFPGGLAAIWAAELTRESIFDALRNRRCYGTTGTRIILDFRVNGHPMGSILESQTGEEPREIAVYVRGTDAVERIEITRNGKVAFTHPDQREECRLEWKDEAPGEADTFYYVRIFQSDGEMAWSSPIWIDKPGRGEQGNTG